MQGFHSPKSYIFKAFYVMLGLEASIAKAFDIPNPITAGSFSEVVLRIAQILTNIGIPLATIFLIYSGVLFVSARGNEDQLKKAKTTFWYTIIGTAILVGAYAIAQAVVQFAQQL